MTPLVKTFQKGTLRAGFEPARGDPIRFRVQRLNHSAIAAAIKVRVQNPLISKQDILPK